MKVSISLITYQHADTAQQALESVLLQDTDFEFETILGDDASTDGSQKILLDCLPMARGPVKTLFRETNAQDRGLTNVVQTIDAAEGEYIAFIDGDDFWTDMKKLQKQVDFLDAHPECAMCAHRVLHQRDDGGTACPPRPPMATAFTMSGH